MYVHCFLHAEKRILQWIFVYPYRLTFVNILKVSLKETLCQTTHTYTHGLQKDAHSSQTGNGEALSLIDIVSVVNLKAIYEPPCLPSSN